MTTADTVTKRIHVGGLTPSITPAHIRDRFKSFGDVTQVEEMSVDGLGQPRPFTFFTIQTSSAQLRKCLNVMSGSTWRGCQLRLAEAKVKYGARLEKERNPSKELVEDRLRKRKRRILTARGQDMGKEAQDMRIPDDKTYKSKKFWTADDGNHLIRPVAIRPTHALPPMVEPVPPKAGTSKRKAPRSLPVKRARIRVIDPSRWRPTHLTEQDLPGSAERSENGWAFESEDEGEEDEDGRVLVGRWARQNDDDEQEEEEVWVAGKRVDGTVPEEDDADLEDLVGGAARDRFASPLFASRQQDGTVSPLFGSRQEMPAESPDAEDDKASEVASLEDEEAASVAEPGPSRSRSTSPLFPSREQKSASPLFPTRTVKPVSPEPIEKSQPEPKKEATTTTSLPDPMREIVRAEKSRDLGLLASFLGEEVEVAAKPTRGEWAGFDEDEDDDDFEYPLRIRGGRADSEDENMSDSSSDSDSDSEDDSSSDSDDEDEESSDGQGTAASSVTAPAVTAPAAAAPAPPVKPQSALKAMFAPAPAQSTFSLLGALDADIELDEELDIPLAPPPIRRAAEPEPELRPLTQTKKSHFDPNPEIPLFFPSFGKGGKDAMRDDADKEGYTGFWRQETDEDMKEIWEKDKVELTRDWKKRYREGRKQKKRRGGANEVE